MPPQETKTNYKIYRKEVEVDPYKVNWKKIRKDAFPYKVVQQPGPKNSLGIIKFEFHNKYSVYIHDTPSKGFFNSDVRSFSHGCMRCENPVELGRILLANDSLRRKANPMIADSLDTFLGRAQNCLRQPPSPSATNSTTPTHHTPTTSRYKS